jgi:hypothetical protein
MQCAQRQHENREGLNFCNQCGALLSGHCAQCGFEYEAGSKFCNHCGVSLTAYASGAASGQPFSLETTPESRFQAL